MQIIISIVCFGLFLVFLTLIHEGLHIIGFNYYGIPFKWAVFKKYHIPLGVALNSPYFEGSFKDLSKYKQKQYFIIALLPYLFFVPFFYFVSCSSDIYVAMYGYLGLITHFLNLPLEFVNTEDDKNVMDKKKIASTLDQ